MKYRKLLAIFLLFAFIFTGCSKTVEREIKVRQKEKTKTTAPTETSEDTVPTDPTESEPTATTKKSGSASDGILDLSMFINFLPNYEMSEDNTIRELIAEKTGVRITETYSTLMSSGDPIDQMMMSGDLPDLIDGGADGNIKLYENDYLVAWDPYLEMYPELKALYSDYEWDQFRMDDGHIYWANVSGNHFNNVDTSTGHNESAFWIQARVLEELGYPLIETVDDYFKALDTFYKLHPETDDGADTIPFTILCESWRYYCLESPPMFLDGYPNDGCCIVDTTDPSNPVVIDYNTTDTAQRYFKTLNEAYQNGLIDPDFANQTYDEYIEKLSTGCVLGMCDQYWDFAYSVDIVFDYTYVGDKSMSELGYNYVPLGLTIDRGMTNQWHTYGDSTSFDSGVAVTTFCQDPNMAFKFMDDLLSQEIHDLRFWGIEGEDYLVDENGVFYRTPEMRMLWDDSDYLRNHACRYDNCPQWLGMSRDNINMMQPSEQPGEFLASLPEPVANCLVAYGATTYGEMMRSEKCATYPWYPMWSWSNNLTNVTDEGAAFAHISETKHEYLPKVVMSEDFDSEWKTYMEAYDKCKPEDFIEGAQKEVDLRLELAREAGYEG